MAPTLPLHASLQLLARSDASPDSASLPPSGARALIGIVVMLSLIVLGFTAWRIHVFRTGRKARQNAHVRLHDTVNEQHAKRSLSNATVNLTPPQAVITRDRHPAELRANLGYEPNVIYIAPQQNPPQSPKVSPRVVNLAIIPPAGPPPYDQSMAKTPKSPRTTASMIPKLHAPKSGLPRSVIVVSIFPPSLHDELEIHVGETLQLLEEYEDEWCLVQRVGPKDTARGVIPRFCISDKPELPAVRRTKHIPQLSTDMVI